MREKLVVLKPVARQRKRVVALAGCHGSGRSVHAHEAALDHVEVPAHHEAAEKHDVGEAAPQHNVEDAAPGRRGRAILRHLSRACIIAELDEFYEFGHQTMIADVRH